MGQTTVTADRLCACVCVRACVRACVRVCNYDRRAQEDRLYAVDGRPVANASLESIAAVLCGPEGMHWKLWCKYIMVYI